MIVFAFKELFNIEVTMASYYFIFFCIGIIFDLVLLLKGDYANYFQT